jgi:hypothetical protein
LGKLDTKSLVLFESDYINHFLSLNVPKSQRCIRTC